MTALKPDSILKDTVINIESGFRAVIIPSVFQRYTSWNTAGILLEYCWNTAGILLDYCWNTTGKLLENSWNTAGIMTSLKPDSKTFFKASLNSSDCSKLSFVSQQLSICSDCFKLSSVKHKYKYNIQNIKTSIECFPLQFRLFKIAFSFSTIISVFT